MKTTKVLPPRIFLIALLTLGVIHFLIPVWFLYDSPFRYTGILPIFVGSYLNMITDKLFKERKTTIKPFEMPAVLMIEGPFRYSRNPLYLGLVLIVAGFSILSGSLLSFIIPIIFAIILHYRYILIEEKFLEESFGDEYLNYKSRVRRWI